MRFALLAVLAIATAACGSSAPAPTAPSSPPPQATAAPAATPDPTRPPSTIAPAAEPPDCRERTGRIVFAEVRDPALSRSLPYRVYLPPCAAEFQGRLPALYLLHGLARTDAQWDDLGADEHAERLIRAGEFDPFLIVMPWERKGLDFERTIVEYLIPQVELRYGAGPERAIGGISRGAGWALRIGLLHPESFDAIGLHSPAVIAPDLFNIPGWVASAELPTLWIDVGDRDTLRFDVQELRDLLDELDVPYQGDTFSGEHTADYWSEHVPDYLSWYVSIWN